MTSTPLDLDGSPVDTLRRWLLDEWDGPFEFLDVRVERHATGDGEREAWYIHPIVEGGPDTRLDARELGVVDVAVRDKALELGIEYPWFVFVQVSDPDEPMEDDGPPPPRS